MAAYRWKSARTEASRLKPTRIEASRPKLEWSKWQLLDEKPTWMEASRWKHTWMEASQWKPTWMEANRWKPTWIETLDENLREWHLLDENLREWKLLDENLREWKLSMKNYVNGSISMKTYVKQKWKPTWMASSRWQTYVREWKLLDEKPTYVKGSLSMKTYVNGSFSMTRMAGCGDPSTSASSTARFRSASSHSNRFSRNPPKCLAKKINKVTYSFCDKKSWIGKETNIITRFPKTSDNNKDLYVEPPDESVGADGHPRGNSWGPLTRWPSAPHSQHSQSEGCNWLAAWGWRSSGQGPQLIPQGGVHNFMIGSLKRVYLRELCMLDSGSLAPFLSLSIVDVSIFTL